MNMQWPLLIPLAAITLGPASWVANTWIRARHGYPIENMMTGSGGVSAARTVEVLAAGNARLDGKVTRLEERIAVLERVVTDNHGSLGLDREIERLRNR